MGKFIKKFEEARQSFMLSNDGDDISVLEYVGGYIFDFTTYDTEICEIMTRDTLDVIQCILAKKTFDYIDVSKDNYLNYIRTINMPFFTGKLKWGASVRGAWFEYSDRWNSESLYFPIKENEMVEFLTDILEYTDSFRCCETN